MVLPAPLGPISPTISPGPTVRSKRLTACSPPKRLLSPRTSSPALTPRRPAGPAAPQPAHEPVRQERDDQDQDQPVEHDVGARPAAQHRARDLGDRREHEGAQERAGHRAGAAHDRGQQPADRDGGPEGQARVDVGEVLRVEGPAQRGEEGRHRHRGELGGERVHAGRLRRVLVLADRGQRVAHARALDRAADQQRRPVPWRGSRSSRAASPRTGTAAARSPGSARRGRARSRPPSSSPRRPAASRRRPGSPARSTGRGARSGTRDSRRRARTRPRAPRPPPCRARA